MAKHQQTLQLALQCLSRLIPETRRTRLQSVARARCAHVALLLENITDFGNHNAALRTMEALGLQYVHRVVERGVKKYASTRTDAGAKQWLSIRDWESTAECVDHLRIKGYRIISSSLNSRNRLQDIDLDQRTVVAFGNEHAGISSDLEQLSDDTFFLPMWGFVESYNVSVAVALSMFHCRLAMENSPYCVLTEVEYNEILLKFYITALGESKAKLVLKSEGLDIKNILQQHSD